MEHLLKENDVPKCPFNNCKGEILYSEIKSKNNDNLMLKYRKLIINYLQDAAWQRGSAPKPVQINCIKKNVMSINVLNKLFQFVSYRGKSGQSVNYHGSAGPTTTTLQSG